MFGQWGMGYGYGGIFMILWWVLIIGGIVAIGKWLATPSSIRGHQLADKSALDILKERYARGEIEQEEFQRKKRELSE